MKFFLIVSLATLCCFLEMKEVNGDEKGNYPVDFQGVYYECIVHPNCPFYCKIHGASYGYCYAGVCYCEGLADADKDFWDVMKKQCDYM
uniref:NaTx n=1 Tax=Centruroides hentzi TaxID=88313 RepID=A0A2I9LPA4_9SCOR